MRKKCFQICALILLLTGGLFLIAGQAGATEGELLLFHRFTNEPMASSFQRVADAYMEKNPEANITIEALPNDEYKAKLDELLRSGGELPDILFTRTGEFTNRFARAGKLLPLSAYFDADDYMPGQVDAFTYERELWALPYVTNTKLWFYNTQALAELGYTAPPQDYAEFLAICEKYQQTTGRPAIAFGNSTGWAALHYVGALFLQMVPQDILTADCEGGSWTDARYLDALQTYQALLAYCNADPNALAHHEARKNWLEGDHLFMYLESVELEGIEREKPQDFSYDVFAWPDMNSAGKSDYLLSNPDGLMISAQTEYPELAVDFLRFATGWEAGVVQKETVDWLSASPGVVDKKTDSAPLLRIEQMQREAKGIFCWLDSYGGEDASSRMEAAISALTAGNSSPEEAMAAFR